MQQARGKVIAYSEGNYLCVKEGGDTCEELGHPHAPQNCAKACKKKGKILVKVKYANFCIEKGSYVSIPRLSKADRRKKNIEIFFNGCIKKENPRDCSSYISSLKKDINIPKIDKVLSKLFLSVTMEIKSGVVTNLIYQYLRINMLKKST